MTAVRRLALPAALTCAAVLLPAGAAAAVEPERTGWWNRVSAGPLTAPAPTAQPGDLRVAAIGPDEPTAYAAVLYSAPGSTSATLDVALRAASGTPEVVACPTETTEWPEGGNQPYDRAPAYDCAVGTSFGSLSEDRKTLSFELDSSTQIEPGVWSLALVPQPESTSGPFSVDILEPGPEAFQAAPPEAPSTDSTVQTDSSSTGDAGSGTSGEPFVPGGFAPPPAFDTGTALEAPLVAGGADTVLPESASTAPEPMLATGAAPAATPLLLARPTGVAEDLGAGRRLLALLVLAGGSAAVGYAAGQQRPGPRLIGGRSRLVPAVPAPAAAGAPPAEERPRGIGRFAKIRDAAPRRLR